MKQTILLLFISTLVFGQFFGGKKKGLARPYFKLIHKEVFDETEGKTLTEIQVQINYDDLVFNRQVDGTYLANYNVTLKLVDAENKFIKNLFKHKTLPIVEFNDTNLRNKKSFTKFHFDLDSKKYRANVLLEDEHSKKSFINSIAFTPTTQAANFSISDLHFYEVDPDTKEKKLNEGQLFSDRKGKLLIQFKANFKTEIDSIFYRVNITSLSNMKSVYFNKLNLATKKNSSNVEIFFDKEFFTDASYKFSLEAIVDSLSSVKKETAFSFVWYRSPNTLTEMETALKQMYYIINSDSVDILIESKNLEESKKFFVNSWKKLTSRQSEQEAIGLMSEYFNRVKFSNLNFGKQSGKNSGWKTDRGRILIKFGKPDEIQRFPFQSNSRPYIIWQYFNEKKYFIFVETLHNEYRLSESTRHFEFQ